MQTERVLMRQIVIGEYRVLLRMEGDLFLPIAYPKIRAFYETLCQNTLVWGKEVLGKSLCKEYADLPDPLSKSRFPTTRCNLFIEIPYEGKEYAAIVCSARWSGKVEGLHRYVGVWQLSEELLLPPREVKKHKEIAEKLAAFGEKKKKKD